LFSGLSVLGSFYCFMFLKETKYLSDKEKKELFMPEKDKQIDLTSNVKSSGVSLSSNNSAVEVEDVTMRYKSLPKKNPQDSFK
jgi:hypothetical protein